MKISLQPGENKLIVFTENEGKVKPCTVAIEVVDDNQSQHQLLRSNLNQSSCLIINNVK